MKEYKNLFPILIIAFISEINLSNEQQIKIQDVHKAFQEVVQALLEVSILNY